MPPLITGLFFGFIFLFAPGPAFFALIQTSLQYGYKKAILFALGVLLGDIIYITLTLLGMAKILESEDFKFWMAVFGAIMLLVYAVYSWVKQPKLADENSIQKDSSYLKYLIRGLLLNALNPFIIVSWATWASAIAINFNYGINAQIQFFIGMLITIFSLDLCKAFIAHRLKHLITVRFIKNMNRTVAIVLIIFTLRIFYYIWENFSIIPQ